LAVLWSSRSFLLTNHRLLPQLETRFTIQRVLCAAQVTAGLSDRYVSFFPLLLHRAYLHISPCQLLAEGLTVLCVKGLLKLFMVHEVGLRVSVEDGDLQERLHLTTADEALLRLKFASD